MILFICHGNVARSQFAEALYKNLTGGRAFSAGTHVKPEKEGNRLEDDGESARTAVTFFKKITGIDISRAVRKPVTPELVEGADKIIVLTNREHLPDWLTGKAGTFEYWNIEDPHGMDFAGYEKTVTTIKEKLDALRQE